MEDVAVKGWARRPEVKLADGGCSEPIKSGTSCVVQNNHDRWGVIDVWWSWSIVKLVWIGLVASVPTRGCVGRGCGHRQRQK